MVIRSPSDRRCSLEMQVRETIREYNMLLPGERVIVGVSGGADSTALLLCLHYLSPDLSLTLTVAHLNHGIRGLEGDADEEFVRRMSAELNLRFVCESVEVKREAEAGRQNIEELARQKRYDFLNRAARQAGAQKIAVGHNLNDQAETVLFRFIRGSGLEGLSGIHPIVNGLVIRPLLECSRESIIQYLKQKNAPYREDSSNRDLQYARNRIRRELLPYLENNFNPRLISTIAHEAFLARETAAFMDSQAGDSFERLNDPFDNGILLKLNGFIELHPALQRAVLRRALKQCRGSLRGIGYVHVRDLLNLCKTGRSGERIQIPHGGLGIRQPDALLLLRHAPPPDPSFSYVLSVPGSCRVPEDRAAFHCTIGPAPDRDAMKERRFTQAFFEPSVLPRSLTIRPRKPGDRYGGPGRRKVKKMLIDSKVPRVRRSLLPMVAVGNDIIWIPGFRPARGYEAQPKSLECVVIEKFRDST